MSGRSRMASRYVLVAAIVAGMAAVLTMLVVAARWMSVPAPIVYRESSGVRTDLYSIEVREHGQSFFLTLQQKKELDAVRNNTPVFWFGGLGVAVLSILIGAAALLRMPMREFLALRGRGTGLSDDL